MGSSSDIDTSVAALLEAWRLFRCGKHTSRDIAEFEYHLEGELMALSRELTDGSYEHRPYQEFVVSDSKKRRIAVAAVRDRVVHRLLYEYLDTLYDKTFYYDVWSCRRGKGLDKAAERVQQHMRGYADGWLWRSDITKFFDSIDHEILMALLRRRVSSEQALALLGVVVASYRRAPDSSVGLAIGNLTSQIAANIYLHEYDHFVSHTLRPLGYVRYGDDIVLWLPDEPRAREVAEYSGQFLKEKLHLMLNRLNPSSTMLQPTRQRLRYIGMEFWPSGHRLNTRMRARLRTNVTMLNFASYGALARSRGTKADRQALRQILLERLYVQQ